MSVIDSQIVAFARGILNKSCFDSPQVSPLFQKLEPEQIESLKKKFGGQQVCK